MEEKAPALDLMFDDIEIKYEVIDDNANSHSEDDDESGFGIESFNYNQEEVVVEEQEDYEEKYIPSPSFDDSRSSNGSNWSESESQKLEPRPKSSSRATNRGKDKDTRSRYAARYANETPEQRKARLEKAAAYERERKARLTPEQRLARLSRCAETARLRKQALSPEALAARRKRESESKKRANARGRIETAEQAVARLARRAANKRREMLRQTPEQRARRLAKAAERRRELKMILDPEVQKTKAERARLKRQLKKLEKQKDEEGTTTTTQVLVDAAFGCAMCFKSYGSSSDLRNHVKLEHSTTTTIKKSPPEGQESNKSCCRLCGKNFKDVATLNKHTAKLHPSSETNNKSASCATASSRELGTETPEEEVEEEEEEAIYVMRNRVRSHNETPEEARAVRLAKYHEYNQTKRKPKVTKRRRRHRDSITAEINCRLCDKSFKYLASMDKHINQAHHPSSSSSSSSSELSQILADLEKAKEERRAERLAKDVILNRLRRQNQSAETKAAKLAKYQEYNQSKRKPKPSAKKSPPKINQQDSRSRSRSRSEVQTLRSCSFCDKSFKYLVSLKKHIISSHPSSSGTLLQDLEKEQEARRRERLAKEVIQYRLRRQTQSPETKAARLAQQREYRAKRKADANLLNKCRFCGKTFADVASRNKHASVVHPELVAEAERKKQVAATRYAETRKLKRANEKLNDNLKNEIPPEERAARLAKMREYNKRKRERDEAKAIEELKRNNYI